MGMQRPTEINPLAALLATTNHVEIPRDRLALMVVQLPRLFITHPGVSTATARVDPEYVLEAKVVPQRRVEDLDGHGHELPALVANVGLVAARADVVVVCQVDIEAEFLGEGPEGGRVAEDLAIARVGGVDGADFYTRWHQAEDVLAEPNSGVS